ncbi:MAG TPA: tetratricopeptide repeat protein [Longimicrobiales bacterium]|nr:tetratricopeptide repeat protein [Longimicrobiales bacterium]
MMRRRRWAHPAGLWAAVLAAVTVTGCATKSDIRDLQDELSALAARQDSLLVQLRYQALSTQDTLRTQSDQLFDFRGEITRQLQQMSQTLARLEAIAGENQRGIASLRAGGGAGGPVVSGPGGGVQPPPRQGPETVAGASNAEQLWSAAREQHQRGSFTTALRAYEQFLSEHPNDARAPDARYFRADILEQQNRPEDALAAFLEIQSLHPTSPRVPDALYRAGVLQHELGDDEAARATLQRLINTYPEHLTADLARGLLEELG